MSVDLPTHDGRTLTVGRAARGRVQVAWFFPMANTPNCTVQARQLLASWAQVSGVGADVVGVSFDPPQVLAQWAGSLGAPFPFCSATLADAEELGAARPEGDPWRGAIPLRVALITNDQGDTLALWPVRDVNSFAAQVLSALNLR